jgi:hypothetical protein
MHFSPADIYALPSLSILPWHDMTEGSSVAGLIFDLSFWGSFDLEAASSESRLMVERKMKSDYVNDWCGCATLDAATFDGKPFALLQRWGRRDDHRRIITDIGAFRKAFSYIHGFVAAPEIDKDIRAADRPAPVIAEFGGMRPVDGKLVFDTRAPAGALADIGEPLKTALREFHARWKAQSTADAGLHEPSYRRAAAEALVKALDRDIYGLRFELHIADYIDTDADWVAVGALGRDGVAFLGLKAQHLDLPDGLWISHVGHGLLYPDRSSWDAFIEYGRDRREEEAVRNSEAFTLV